MIAGTGFLIYKHAFVLKESDVTKIWTLIGERTNAVNATVFFSDKIKRTFSSHKELIELENPRSREILGIEFKANSEDLKQRVFVYLESSELPIRFSIDGDETYVSRLLSVLSDLIDGMKPWYSSIARTSLFFVIPPVAGLTYLVRAAAKMTSGQPSQVMDFVHTLYSMFFLILFLVGTPLLSWWLDKVRSRLFLNGAFCIGQGKERFVLLEKWQWLAVPSFVVSVIASVLGALLIRK